MDDLEEQELFVMRMAKLNTESRNHLLALGISREQIQTFYDECGKITRAFPKPNNLKDEDKGFFEWTLAINHATGVLFYLLFIGALLFEGSKKEEVVQ